MSETTTTTTKVNEELGLSFINVKLSNLGRKQTDITDDTTIPLVPIMNVAAQASAAVPPASLALFKSNNSNGFNNSNTTTVSIVNGTPVTALTSKSANNNCTTQGGSNMTNNGVSANFLIGPPPEIVATVPSIVYRFYIILSILLKCID